MSYGMALFDEIRQILRFLVECLSSWIAMSDGVVPYDSNASNYEAMIEENEALVYIKGHEKQKWLMDILDSDIIIKILDAHYAHYKDIESLSNPDDCNTIRCGKHAKNYALQNEFKIFNCNNGSRDARKKR